MAKSTSLFAFVVGFLLPLASLAAPAFAITNASSYTALALRPHRYHNAEMVFTWVPTFCIFEGNCFEDHDFYLHSLWAADADGDPIEPTGECEPAHGSEGYLTAIENNREGLEAAWPTFDRGLTSQALWEQQWCNHGRATGLPPNYYFSQAVNERNNIDLLHTLAVARITPSDTRYYSRAAIVAAFQERFGIENTIISCRLDEPSGTLFLDQVYVCFNKEITAYYYCPDPTIDRGCGDDIDEENIIIPVSFTFPPLPPSTPPSPPPPRVPPPPPPPRVPPPPPPPRVPPPPPPPRRPPPPPLRPPPPPPRRPPPPPLRPPPPPPRRPPPPPLRPPPPPPRRPPPPPPPRRPPPPPPRRPPPPPPPRRPPPPPPPPPRRPPPPPPRRPPPPPPRRPPPPPPRRPPPPPPRRPPPPPARRPPPPRRPPRGPLSRNITSSPPKLMW